MNTAKNNEEARREEIRRGLHKHVTERRQGYRDQALKLFPHICASCGREFEGKRLRELTVHHKDHDHNNNPADGGNWELLCLYCHDHQHEKYKMTDYRGHAPVEDKALGKAVFSPFADLDKLITGDAQ